MKIFSRIKKMSKFFNHYAPIELTRTFKMSIYIIFFSQPYFIAGDPEKGYTVWIEILKKVYNIP